MKDRDVMAGPTAVHRSFRSESAAVPDARRFAIEAWHGLREPGEEVNGGMPLVVSELATNAVLHTGGGFTVTLAHDDDVLRVSVADGESEHPAPVDSERSMLGGRGLRIVDLLADRWGVDDLGDGKAVWVEFRLESVVRIGSSS